MSRDRAFQAKYYHALNLLPSLGPVRIKRLVQRFGTPEQVWQAVPRDLAGVEGFTAALREKISREWQKVDPVQAWEKIIQQGYSFIVWEDSRYPLLLREKGAENVLVIAGGVIPEKDIPHLKSVGIANIFPPGTHTNEIVKYIRERV